jgi:transcriptional regulator with XRE-family HTH domain
MELATQLAAARRDAGLTQAQLAEAVGSSAATISHYETGHRVPSLARLCELADALGVTVGSLLRQGGHR